MRVLKHPILTPLTLAFCLAGATVTLADSRRAISLARWGGSGSPALVRMKKTRTKYSAYTVVPARGFMFL